MIFLTLRFIWSDFRRGTVIFIWNEKMYIHVYTVSNLKFISFKFTTQAHIHILYWSGIHIYIYQSEGNVSSACDQSHFNSNWFYHAGSLFVNCVPSSNDNHVSTRSILLSLLTALRNTAYEYTCRFRYVHCNKLHVYIDTIYWTMIIAHTYHLLCDTYIYMYTSSLSRISSRYI